MLEQVLKSSLKKLNEEFHSLPANTLDRFRPSFVWWWVILSRLCSGGK